jgi:hypothetical protein
LATRWASVPPRGPALLLPPEAAIDPSEDAVSIEATYAMRASFAAGGFATAALKFFDALVEMPTGVGERH